MSQFRNDRTINLHTDIPCRHQSLVANERRYMYFKDISNHILDKRKRRTIETADWEEYASMCTMRLNPQVQQYDGFTPARRVSGRTPKLPIGAVGSPDLCDFANPNDSTETQTRAALVKLGEIQRSSLESDSVGKLNFPLIRSLRGGANRRIIFRANCLFIERMAQIKSIQKGTGRGLLFGGFVGSFLWYNTGVVLLKPT